MPTQQNVSPVTLLHTGGARYPSPNMGVSLSVSMSPSAPGVDTPGENLRTCTGTGCNQWVTHSWGCEKPQLWGEVMQRSVYGVFMGQKWFIVIDVTILNTKLILYVMVVLLPFVIRYVVMTSFTQKHLEC